MRVVLLLAAWTAAALGPDAWTAPGLTLRGGAGGDSAAAAACEGALASAKASASTLVSRWRRDVDDGRLCPTGWSAEASALFSDTLEAFDAATRPHWAAAGGARAGARAELSAFLALAIDAAHRDQLASAADRRLRQLRAALARAHGSRGDGAGSETFDAELQKAEHRFDADATRCVVDALDLDGAGAKAAFSDEARALVRDFGDSPTARLASTKRDRVEAARATKAAARAARAETGRGKAPSLVPKAVNLAFQLVGMLRPRGFGNFQGFASYAMGPHSLLFGYADDRDASGNDMGGDDAAPLLRLQPKFTLDVDL